MLQSREDLILGNSKGLDVDILISCDRRVLEHSYNGPTDLRQGARRERNDTFVVDESTASFEVET